MFITNTTHIPSRLYVYLYHAANLGMYEENSRSTKQEHGFEEQLLKAIFKDQSGKPRISSFVKELRECDP